MLLRNGRGHKVSCASGGLAPLDGRLCDLGPVRDVGECVAARHGTTSGIAARSAAGLPLDVGFVVVNFVFLL